MSRVFPADWSAAGSGSSLGGICVLGGSVGAVVGIKVDFCAAAGATASESVIVQGGNFVVAVVPIAWNAMNALYEPFVVDLVLVLGAILIPTRRRFCLVVFVVVLFMSDFYTVILDILYCRSSCRMSSSSDFRIVLGISGGDVGSFRVLAVGVIFVVLFICDGTFGVIFVFVLSVITVHLVCVIAVVGSYCLLLTSMSTGVRVVFFVVVLVLVVVVVVRGVGCLPHVVMSSSSSVVGIRVVCCWLLAVGCRRRRHRCLQDLVVHLSI